MPRNEDGEFELVLANRQLLSVFFIVVILLGVFFTMGYIVGRSSSPVVTADATAARREETKPLVVDSPAPPAKETPPAATPADAPKGPISTAPQQPTEPAPDTKAAPAPAQQEKQEKREPPPVAAKAAAPAGGKGEPVAGEKYLQLVATAKAEADVMLDVLKKKGFNAIESPVPGKDGWFRVLVGPVADGAMNKTKADLQAAGFPGDKSIPKTF